MKRMEVLTMIADGLLLGIALVILAAVFQEMIALKKEVKVPWAVGEVLLLVVALIAAGSGVVVLVLA